MIHVKMCKIWKMWKPTTRGLHWFARIHLIEFCNIQWRHFPINSNTLPSSLVCHDWRWKEASQSPIVMHDRLCIIRCWSIIRSKVKLKSFLEYFLSLFQNLLPMSDSCRWILNSRKLALRIALKKPYFFARTISTLIYSSRSGRWCSWYRPRACKILKFYLENISL